MARSLIGKKVHIHDQESIYFGEWGRVIAEDEDGLFYVAIADGTDSVPVFDETQFIVEHIEGKSDI